jgi:hypothetical protein
MTPEEAKRILSLYRPGSADENDPDFAEALDLADPGRRRNGRQPQIDPELSRWFRQHCAAFLSVRAKLREIQPPAALKDQILAEYKIHVMPTWSSRRLVLAYAAAAVLLIGGLLTLFFVRRAQHDFALYRQAVVAKAVGPYSMDLQTNDLAAINNFLVEHHAPSDAPLPGGLQTAKAVGCAVINWHGKPATMVCFQTGKPLGTDEVADLWLFVANDDDLVHAPEGTAPAIQQQDDVTTAAWSQNGKVYMLGIKGDPKALQKYL